MKQTGIVEAVNGSDVKVRVKRSSACGDNCASCGLGCGGREIVVTAENKAGAKKGDTVEIEMKSSKILGAAAWVYMIPVIFFIIGDIIFNSIFHNELIAAAGGLGTMAAIYIAIIVINRKNKDKYRLIVEKVV